MPSKSTKTEITLFLCLFPDCLIIDLQDLYIISKEVLLLRIRYFIQFSVESCYFYTFRVHPCSSKEVQPSGCRGRNFIAAIFIKAGDTAIGEISLVCHLLR